VTITGGPGTDTENAVRRPRRRRLLVGAARDVTIVDPAPALGGDGAYHRALPCESWEQAVCEPDGTIVVRDDDGIHLTEAGGERYARVLLSALGHPVVG
jgi:hypothetical protein